MSQVRPPAVAGTFYPGHRLELDAVVRAQLAQAPAAPAAERPPKALIAPHAGYVYSGPIAAAAYRSLAALRGKVSRVVLLGPAHRVPLRGLGASSADAFATPLGTVPLDREATERALALPQVRVHDGAHALEHSLEVHLPFLQEVLGPFRLLPLVVGDARPEEVAEVLDLLWGGDETLVVVSSDLSHYHDYATARRLDAATTRAIEALDPDAIDFEQACGRIPVQGLLLAARRHGLRPSTLDVRNSGDTAGTRDSVVGYGAWVFRADAPRDPARPTSLRALARRAIEFGLREARGLPLDPESLPPAWREPRATFVTLRRGGQLRGCTGSLEARQPLACDVAHNAYRSAFADPRFPPLQPGELADLDVSVSVLGPLEPLGARSEEELVAQLRPGLDGLVLSEGPRSATFLPAVWDSLPDPRDFLDALRRKAGLPPGYWSSTLRFERYAVEEAG